MSDSATPWTVAYEAPLSMGFSRQEYWSGFPFPSLGDLPNPGIESGSPALEADALPSEPPGKSYRDDHVKTLPEALGGPLAIRKIPAALTDCGFLAPPLRTFKPLWSSGSVARRPGFKS